MQHPVDLHSHTRRSDGILSPRDLVKKAQADGVTTLALTDHDTLSGIAEASATATEIGLRLVPGIELSVTHHGKDLHVLGLFVNPTDGPLAELLESRRFDRISRVREILGKLRRLGVELTYEDVEAQSVEDGSIGRPHVARALVAAGHANSIDHAFERWLGNKAPAYVPYPRLSAESGIAAVHAAGGITSLAHPGVDSADGELESLVELGLDAVECWHPGHSVQEQGHFHHRAQTLGILTTGGSDFHGAGGGHALTLGQPGCPPEAFAALEAKAEQYR